MRRGSEMGESEMWFLQPVAAWDSPGTRWGKHYFTCQVCELGESFGDPDTFCQEGEALKIAAIASVPETVEVVEYLTHLSDAQADEGWHRDHLKKYGEWA
jgi:hypothetical protein